jgi:hypothetical protein
MVRAIFSITLFMGIAIFFLESSSGSIRIDWALERRGGEWKKIEMVRGSYEISLKLRWENTCVLCTSRLRLGDSKQELDRIRHFILLL